MEPQNVNNLSRIFLTLVTVVKKREICGIQKNCQKLVETPFSRQPMLHKILKLQTVAVNIFAFFDILFIYFRTCRILQTNSLSTNASTGIKISSYGNDFWRSHQFEVKIVTFQFKQRNGSQYQWTTLWRSQTFSQSSERSAASGAGRFPEVAATPATPWRTASFCDSLDCTWS